MPVPEQAGYRCTQPAKDSEMKVKQDKTYRLLKKKHIIPSIIGMLLTIVLLAVLATVLAGAIIGYVMDDKIEAEYKSVSEMVRIYDYNEKSGSKYAFEELAGPERDYIVVDKDNNPLTVKGENTCSFKGGEVRGVDESFKVLVYFDNDDTYVYIDDEETLSLKTGKLFKKIWKDLASDSDPSDEKDETRIPFWISQPLADGERSLVVKCNFAVKQRDVFIVAVLVALAAIVLFALFIVSFVKIIKRFLAQRKLMNLFFTDNTTEGRNWMWFVLKSGQTLGKKKNNKNNYAILNVDFVKYNNYCVCHSVEEGERALKSINEMIERTLDKKELCARKGDSSFAVMMQYNDEAKLKNRVGNLVNVLEGIYQVHRFGFHVGVRTLPFKILENKSYASRKGISVENEYSNACVASASLENSDESGIALFDEKLIEEQIWIDAVTERQQKAVANEEFVVYYQPKYDPNTNELRGAEALIRWESPEFGFVTPGRIIPIFEKNGFITEIDHYMISHVARDQKKWLDAGYKCVPVSVNVSRAHFIESNLAEQIRDMVDKEGAPRNLIEIELTESAFFDDKKALVTTISKLKEYGFAVSMDDFGAGYSSLNSLKDLPLDVLKLDAEFFRGENEGERGEIVVSEAIKLAKSLNMRTVAEGVEVKEQVEFLANQGCDMIQGFYFAKPMPKDEYEGRMKEGVAGDLGVTAKEDKASEEKAE